jgi:hypothetical protein
MSGVYLGPLAGHVFVYCPVLHLAVWIRHSGWRWPHRSSLSVPVFSSVSGRRTLAVHLEAAAAQIGGGAGDWRHQRWWETTEVPLFFSLLLPHAIAVVSQLCRTAFLATDALLRLSRAFAAYRSPDDW